jgi:hypothetical protein
VQASKIKNEVINTNEKGEKLIIWAENKNDINDKVKEIIQYKYNQTYDGQGYFKEPQYIGFTGLDMFVVDEDYPEYQILEDYSFEANLPTKQITPMDKLDRPMLLALPYEACFLKHFNEIDKVSYTENNGECVIKTLYFFLIELKN